MKQTLQELLYKGLNSIQIAEHLRLPVEEVEALLVNLAPFKGKFAPPPKEVTWADLWREPCYPTYSHKCCVCGAEEALIERKVDGRLKNNLRTNSEFYCDKCYRETNYTEMPYASVTVSSHFTAGHFLPHYDGACNRVHAHGWKYSVTIRNRVNPHTGMVMDFKVLKEHLKDMEDVIDHRMLNDIFLFEPTAENLVIWMWDYLSKKGVKGITEIVLHESEKYSTRITDTDLLYARNSR